MTSHNICQGYEYTPDRTFDGEDIHLRVIAETILLGIEEPRRGRGQNFVLSGIPKRRVPPGLERKPFSPGWGFYARQALCLRKVLGWVSILLVLGLSFVPIWLALISGVDLQNAFAPVTFLATLMMIGMAIMAIAPSL